MNLIFILSVFSSLVLASNSHLDQHRRHQALANRVPSSNETTLEKRSFSGQATWFNVGLGACGKWSQPGDFMVALNSAQYGGGYPGPNCFKTIEIFGQGTSAQATILDECPGCKRYSVDMSEGLFKHFASLGMGTFPITWNYVGAGGGGGGNDNNDNPPPQHHTTHTTTHTPPPPPPTPTTTHTHDKLTTTTSSSASPSPTPENLAGLEQAVFDLTNLIIEAVDDAT